MAAPWKASYMWKSVVRVCRAVCFGLLPAFISQCVVSDVAVAPVVAAGSYLVVLFVSSSSFR